MNFYQQKGHETADEIRRKIFACHQRIEYKLLANIALTIAEEVAVSTLAGNTLAARSIQQAKVLAAKEDLDRIMLIATDGLKREVEKDDRKSNAELFLHKALEFASKEPTEEDGSTFFEFIGSGLAILYESDPSINWLEKISKKVSL